MSKAYHRQIAAALEDSFLRRTLDKFAVEYRASRDAVFAEIPGRDLIQRIAAVKDAAAHNLESLYAQFKAEAERRGLPNFKTTMDALKVLTKPESAALFEKYGVYRRRELESRYEVFMEDYHRKVRIEGEVALEIAETMIRPALSAEYGSLVNELAAAGTSGVKPGAKSLKREAELLGRGLDDLAEKTALLRTALNGKHEEILAAMAELRKVVDALEREVDDARWPLPKYREMLFVY